MAAYQWEMSPGDRTYLARTLVTLRLAGTASYLVWSLPPLGRGPPATVEEGVGPWAIPPPRDVGKSWHKFGQQELMPSFASFIVSRIVHAIFEKNAANIVTRNCAAIR